jgi:hypothetical protein
MQTRRLPPRLMSARICYTYILLTYPTLLLVAPASPKRLASYSRSKPRRLPSTRPICTCTLPVLGRRADNASETKITTDTHYCARVLLHHHRRRPRQMVLLSIRLVSTAGVHGHARWLPASRDRTTTHMRGDHISD